MTCRECFEEPCDCYIDPPPTQWDLYSVEGGCELREWHDRANAEGLCLRSFFREWYGQGLADRISQIAERESPLMARLKAPAVEELRVIECPYTINVRLAPGRPFSYLET